MDWYGWHEGYQDGGSLQERLLLVQDQLRTALDSAPPGPVKMISVCAGQAHDVVGAVGESARRAEVRALLIEWDPRNVAEAERRIEASGLDGIEIRQGDAGITDSYADAVPVRIVLLCGVFGSLTDADIDRTIGAVPRLCAEGAQVIWTANRATPNLYQEVDAALGRHGFTRIRTDPQDRFGVTRHRLVADPQPFLLGQRMFEFADEQTLIELGRISTP